MTILAKVAVFPVRERGARRQHVDEHAERPVVESKQRRSRDEKEHPRLPGRTRRIRLRHRIDAEDVPRARVRPFVHRVAPKQGREARRRHFGRRIGQGGVLGRQLRGRLDAVFAQERVHRGAAPEATATCALVELRLGGDAV